MSDLVEEAIRHYQDLLAGEHLASTRDSLERINCRLLRPHFLAADEYQRLLDVTTLLNRGVVTAADRLARDPTLRRKVGVPDYMEPLLELDRERGVPAVMARFDGLLDRTGVFNIIEYNASPG